MVYETLDAEGKVINRIIAEPAFVQEKYPGKYRDVTPDVTPTVPVKTIDEKIDDLTLQVAAIYEKVKGIKP